MKKGQLCKKRINIIFGSRIATLRKARCMTQEELAYTCDINRTYMGCIERGEKSPTLDTIQKIANGLGISMRQLFEDEIFQ